MIFAAFVAIAISNIATLVHAGFRSAPGGSFNELGITTFSQSTAKCILSIEDDVESFIPSESYTVTVITDAGFTNAIGVSAGKLIDGGSGRIALSSKCRYQEPAQTITSYTFVAPSSGTVVISAVCGNKKTGEFQAAAKITLAAERLKARATAATSNPTKAPVTSTPTKTPVTSTPTKAPVTPAPTVPTKAPTTGTPTKAPATTAPTVPTKAPTTGAPVAPSKAPTTGTPTTATKSPTKKSSAIKVGYTSVLTFIFGFAAMVLL